MISKNKAFLAVLASAFCLSLAATVVADVSDGTPCAGCDDVSYINAATYPSGNQWFYMGGTVQQFNGECFTIGGDCVMEYPCTPFVEVWGQSYQGGASATGGGSIGGIGLGRTTVTWGIFQSFAIKTFYKDYSGIDCGAKMDFFYTAEWTCFPHAAETGTVTGKLDCTKCS